MEIVVRHVLVDWPRHDLQKIAVERRRDTLAIGSASAGRMYLVHIDASAHDGFEFFKSVASFGPAGLVWGEIARNDVRERPLAGKGTEVSATPPGTSVH